MSDPNERLDMTDMHIGHLQEENVRLQKEIKRLKLLVRGAYKEGGTEGRKSSFSSYFDEDDWLWDHSEARKVLNQSN